MLAGQPAQVWQIGFDGQHAGPITLSLGFDPEPLAGVLEREELVVLHRPDAGGVIEVIDPLFVDIANSIVTFETHELSTFALGTVVPEPASVAAILLALLGFAARRR